MDEMFKDMLEKGLISIEKQINRVDPLPDNKDIFGVTEPCESDLNWWAIRAWVVANDKAKDYRNYSLEAKILMRRN